MIDNKIDDFINREDMYKCLKDIRYSLDCRFEKDADLYITNQLSQEIKSMIRNGKWQGINGMFTTNTISANILSIEILKHAWLITSPLGIDKKYVKEIFNSTDKNILIPKIKSAINGEIYLSDFLKGIVYEIYYTNVDLELCKEILNNEHGNLLFNEDIRKTCVKRVLDTYEDANSLYRNMDRYMDKNDVFVDSDVFKHYMNDREMTEEFTEEFVEHIFEDYIEDENDVRDSKWYKIFRAMGKASFDIALNYIEKNSEYEKEFCTGLSRYVLYYQFKNDDENKDYYLEKIKNSFKTNMEFPYRMSLILGMRSLYEQEIKLDLIEFMLEDGKYSLQPNQKEILEEMKIGGSRPERNIKVDDILSELINDNLPNNKQGRINYTVNLFLKKLSNKKEIKRLSNHLYNKNVQLWFLSLISQGKNYKDFLPEIMEAVFEHLDSNQNYNFEDEVKRMIEAKPNKFESAKPQIQKYDFDFYKMLF